MPNELPELGKIPGFDTTPSTDPSTDAALDAMAAELEKDPANVTDEGNGDKPADEIPAGDVKPKPSDKPADEKPADEKPAGDKPVEKPADEKKEEFEKIELPPHTKPKTGEAFETVKKLARERIASVEKELTDLRKANEELTAKVGKGEKAVTPELEKELAELRSFRNKMEVEADPEFKTYDAKITENTDLIYKKLIAVGTPQATLDKIKELGGPANIDWEPLLAKLPSTTRRAIEAKLVENDDLIDKKVKAIENAKKNADEFVKTRQQQTANQREEAKARAEKEAAALRAHFTWLAPKTAPEKATESEKKEIAAYNAMVKEAEQYVKEALVDDSPEMRATLAFAGPELFKARYELAVEKAKSEATINKLTEELKQSTALLEKVKRNSTHRLRETSGEVTGHSKPSTKETSEETLDRLAREAEEAAS